LGLYPGAEERTWKLAAVKAELDKYQHVLWQVGDFKLEDKTGAETEYHNALQQIDVEILHSFLQENPNIATYDDFVKDID